MDRLRRIATTAETTDGRHAGIVPAVHQAFLDECQQVALAHQRVAQVQLVEFVLARAVVVQILAFFQPIDEEVVERAVYHKLQCTERVGHAFEEVTLAVGEVIHGIGFPFRTRAVVRMFHYTIDDGVAEVHVGVGHVYLGAQHHGTFFYLATVHLLEQLQIFFNRAVAVRTFRTRLGRCTFLCRYFFRRLFVDVSLAFLDEADGKVPKLLEIIRCIIFVAPLVAQPLDILLDGFYVFHVFLRGVGVVETQVAYASVSGCDAEIKADGLGMSDVQVSVRLRREACLHSASIFTVAQVVFYNLLNEVQAFLFACFFVFQFCHTSLIT